nr:hypothetical protein [Bacillaceae bacterium]
MGLFNIFGDSSIIFGFMFILNKNLSDIKEKITIILEVHHPKKNVHHRSKCTTFAAVGIKSWQSMANTRFRFSKLVEMK